MSVRKNVLLGLFGLTAACSGNKAIHYTVPILPIETLHDSPLVSTPVGMALDSTKAAKARKVAQYVYSQTQRKGILISERDTSSLTYYLSAHQITPEGRIVHIPIDSAKAPFTAARSCVSLNNVKYDIIVKNVNEMIVDGVDLDELILMYLGKKGCGENSTFFRDRGLDGRVDQVRFLPDTGFKIAQTNFSKNFNTDTLSTRAKEEIQKVYEQTLDLLLKFYSKKR